jgi:FMN phosphatase YigB (HAD superfamily)
MAGVPDRLTAAVSDPAVELVSLDVFDTLLLRDTEPELARFGGIARVQDAALRRAGFPSPGPGPLYRARLQVHKQAYDAAAATGGEARHDDILRRLCRHCALDEALVPELVRAEVAYEAGRLVANRPLLAWLGRLAPRLRLVLVSDMYLATADLRHLLAAVTPELSALPLYVSAELQRTKRQGGLFPFLAAAERVAPTAILHIGDHPLADVVQPVRAGYRAVHLPRSLPWRVLHRLRERLVRRRLKRLGWLHDSEPPPFLGRLTG